MMGSSSGSNGALDASVDAAVEAAVDTGIDTGPTRPCDVTANFSAPTLVKELNAAANQDGARITLSGLELSLTRDEPPGHKQIHSYTRATLQDPWGNDKIESALTAQFGTGAGSSYMTFADETTAYLSVFQGGGTWRLHRTRRMGPGAAWGAPVPLNLGNSTTTGEMPWINSAGDKLYFMSGGPTTGYRLFVSQAIGTNFQSPGQIMIDTGGTVNQYAPVVSQDGKLLYFAGNTNASRRIFKATGPGGLDFSTGSSLEPNLNIGTTNQLTWLSPDTCEAYLTVDGKIYKARKPN
jgi:hypothetical protein